LKGNTYAVVIRIETIRKRLTDGGALNCGDIAALFDVSLKTAQRDIEFLRSFYGLTIDYDASRRALYLAAPAPPYPPPLDSDVSSSVRGRYPKKPERNAPAFFAFFTYFS